MATIPKKPKKPYPDYPLFAHATKRWAKKIKGKLYYFGPWDNSTAALQKYLHQRDDLQAGLVPRLTPGLTPDGVTLRDLANRFLTLKKSRLDGGELSVRMFNDYRRICERLLTEFGKDRLLTDLRSEDFDKLRANFSKGVGPVTVMNLVRLTKIFIKFAYDSDLIDRPIKVGPGFKGPSAKTLRADRQSKRPRMFEAAEIRRILETAPSHLRAMIFLGINCGFGQSDCSSLPVSAIDLDGSWITYPRPKTAVMRRCPLWSETVDALRQCVATRREPKDSANAGRLFITKQGAAYVRATENGTNVDGIGQEFLKLLKRLDMHGGRRNFYALRHGFETIGGNARDQIAVSSIMGHAPSSSDMSAVYRERIDDERLKAVTGHVHKWLFPVG
jgi:integrase